MNRNKKKGFTLIELLIVVVIVGILALAAIPLITSNTRDARRAEGEQLLGSTRNQARVAFARLGDGLTGKLTDTYAVGGANIQPTELVGQYFGVVDATLDGASQTQVLQADPGLGNNGNDGDGVGVMEFVWATGATVNNAIVWP
jgi:prepilin-type N-terminal cleavage/methylation domain-containing protein